tara:strand:+ start:370 stop:1110 length:741 start_codon:yes stop_codon:yes gene_type:complete
MFIEEVLNISGMVFKKQKDLKEPKYKKLEIFNSGWETIEIGQPPKGNKVVQELKEIQSEVSSATDEQKQQYINCDEDSSYYIKAYMDDHDLEYNQNTIEHIEQQCRPIIRHYKNFYNRPRPYQVAERIGMKFDRFKTGTSDTPAYPSGHTVQPILVAEYYAKMYPQHRAGLLKGAKICGYGRVIAGLHYPSDYQAGVKLGEELIDFVQFDELKEDAPVNSTGAGISMAPTALGKKKKKKKYDIYTR